VEARFAPVLVGRALGFVIFHYVEGNPIPETGDTLVALASGETVPIADLAGSQPDVVTLDGWRAAARPATKVWRTGRKPVFRLVTRTGRVVRATANHPLRKLDGWQALGALQIGDRIAIPRTYPDAAGADAVASIEADGVEDVFDMTVPGTHSFVGNGIYLHNSIEQDSDLVAFLYRDDYYNPDSQAKGEAELILAKHRNGPLRTVRLSFIGHQARFANMARGTAPGGRAL
jgi:replicative DNA helicase